VAVRSQYAPPEQRMSIRQTPARPTCGGMGPDQRSGRRLHCLSPAAQSSRPGRYRARRSRLGRGRPHPRADRAAVLGVMQLEGHGLQPLLLGRAVAKGVATPELMTA
jgi:hypothetical protein